MFAKVDDTDTTDTTTTNIEALMTGSTITEVQTATIPESGKLNQPTQCQPECTDEPDGGIVIHQRTPPPTVQYQPPIQQLTIPVQQPFAAAATGGFNPGNGGGGRGECSRQGRGGYWGGRNQRTLLTN